jgi:hypothetical protein
MTFLGNDHWETSFTPETTGKYEYTVLGWVDHFATWQKGLQKKFDAGQNVTVELMIGAELLEAAADRAAAEHKQQLWHWGHIMREAKDIPPWWPQALSPEVTSLMNTYTDRDHATRYHKVLVVEVERKKALFSSWYEFFPRSTSPEPGRPGTFKDAERILPRVAQMGFDIVYLPPIHPIGRSFRKGRNNSVTSQPGEPGSPWAIGASKAATRPSARNWVRWKTSWISCARPTNWAWRLPLTWPSSAPPTTPTCANTRSGSSGAPTARCSTPKTRPKSTRTCCPSTSRPTTGKTCGANSKASWTSGSARA